MASAGSTIKDLQGPALDRLAIKDSRDLLLVEGFPPYPRASETRALIVECRQAGMPRKGVVSVCMVVDGQQVKRCSKPSSQSSPGSQSFVVIVDNVDGLPATRRTSK